MKDQRGTSLVSVIVSFAVMMIVLLLLQVSITASGRYAARADELWKQAAEAENRYVNDLGEPTWDHMIGLIMVSETGEEEGWGDMDKWRTETDAGDPDGFRIYYIK